MNDSTKPKDTTSTTAYDLPILVTLIMLCLALLVITEKLTFEVYHLKSGSRRCWSHIEHIHEDIQFLLEAQGL